MVLKDCFASRNKPLKPFVCVQTHDYTLCMTYNMLTAYKGQSTVYIGFKLQLEI